MHSDNNDFYIRHQTLGALERKVIRILLYIPDIIHSHWNNFDNHMFELETLENIFDEKG